jgi:Fe-S oxidoreductase
MWDAAKCNMCGECLVRCLYVDYDKGKAAANIQDLMDGQDAEILHRCVTCCACREYCPTGADPFDLILRAMEAKKTFPVPPEAAKIFDLAATIPASVTPGDSDKPALSICIMEANLPPGALSGQMFKGMTVVKGGDYFCYVGYVHLGQESPVAKHARRFIDNLAALGKDIVFLHDDCYAMVHAMIKDYGVTAPFSYMHLYEYLRNYLRDHQSRITPLGKKVAYQRPCASRYTPAKDVFLDEIFQLIGVERVARRYDREDALCCTGAFVRVYPDLAREVQAKNIDDALAFGADALVTLCPMCDRVLRKPSAARGLTKIYVTDLCRMALGEIPFPAA